MKQSTKAELYLYDLNKNTKNQITRYPSEVQPLGQYPYYASPARWNDATNKISYSSSFNEKSVIKSIDTSGGGNRHLTQNNVKAVWHDVSPDGQWITFDGKLNFKADSTTTQIFLMNFDKRSTKRITRGSGYKQGPVFVMGLN